MSLFRHLRADEEDIRATWRKLQPECDALSEDGVVAKLFPSRPEPSPFSRIYVCFAKNLSMWAETAPARIILRFSSKTSHKRNLGVLRNAAVFSLFSFFRMRIAPFSPFFFFCFSFSCLLFFGCRPSCEGRFLFFFFLVPLKKRKKADVLLSFCPSFLRKGEEKTSVQGREKSVTDDIPETLFFFVFCFFSYFCFPFSPFP